MARGGRQVGGISVDGLKELDEALGDLSKATARNVLTRALATAADPILQEAKRRAPVRKGHLKRGLHIRTKMINTVGNREYSAAMKAGKGKAAAIKAMRDARRDAAGTGSFAEVYVQTGKHPQAVFQEFGTAHHAAQPYLEPALDSKGMVALGMIRTALAEEIEKARARAEKKAARIAAKSNTGR